MLAVVAAFPFPSSIMMLFAAAVALVVPVSSVATTSLLLAQSIGRPLFGDCSLRFALLSTNLVRRV
jgi:purine-cytosine permease-like protein